MPSMNKDVEERALGGVEVMNRTHHGQPRRRPGLGTLIALTLALSACGESAEAADPPDAGHMDAAMHSNAADTAVPADAASTELDGTWLSDSWHLALVASSGVLRAYEFTSISCQTYLEVPYEGLAVPALDTVGYFDEGELVLPLLGSAELRSKPVAELPSVCADGGTPPSADPELNFEVLWRSFDEMYSSFDVRAVDWKAQYESLRAKVTPQTTQQELFSLACELTAPLQDPHVAISWGDESCDSKPPPEWLDDEMLAVILGRLDPQTIDEETHLVAGGLIAYRVLPNDVGYVFLPSMGGFAESMGESIEAAHAALDEIVTAFAPLKGMIVDVRFNGGGDDAHALSIASHFADRRRLAFSIQTRSGDDWTAAREYFTEPAGVAQFTKPVVLLTSALTLSAAETFTMAMRALPHVTVLGETTSGGHSNMMYRNLPNGFGFSLPFERTFAHDGVCYEGVGLTPEIDVRFDPDAFIAGEDTMLDRALGELTTR
jgi:carboxyl-terminal processing protease